MSLLEVFFMVSGVIIFFLALDIARKEKFNALHFFVFLLIGSGLLIFTFFPQVLDVLGKIFWLQRGADVLVYGSIVFLLYFVLLLLSKVEGNKHSITQIIREQAIEQSDKKRIWGEQVFLVRVYNEGTVLEDTIDSILQEGYKNILLVDDGSRDDSWNIIQKYSKKYSGIHALRHFQNRGAGAALETGFEYLRRYGDIKYVINFDADGQHRVDEAKKFLQAFKKYPHIKIIFGSRFFKKEGTHNIPFTRKIVLQLGKVFTRIISGARLSDSHNGYRGFHMDAIESIHLTADSMAYASELIEQIMQKKIPYAEVPVDIIYTSYSLQKWQKTSNAIFIGMHTIWTKFFK